MLEPINGRLTWIVDTQSHRRKLTREKTGVWLLEAGTVLSMSTCLYRLAALLLHLTLNLKMMAACPTKMLVSIDKMVRCQNIQDNCEY